MEIRGRQRSGRGALLTSCRRPSVSSSPYDHQPFPSRYPPWGSLCMTEPFWRGVLWKIGCLVGDAKPRVGPSPEIGGVGSGTDLRSADGAIASTPVAFLLERKTSKKEKLTRKPSLRRAEWNLGSAAIINDVADGVLGSGGNQSEHGTYV